MAGQVPAASAAPAISVSSFNRTFSAMSALKPITAKGKGGIGAILPDTVSSTRYVEFDAPYLTEAMKDAGLASSEISVVNAHGSDATEYADAQADIAKGDKVLIMDPLDSGVGAKIESYAASHGVKVIDYDRLTLGGSRAYYVSYNNVHVGQLLGQGLVSCISAWHVKNPQVLVMRGAPTDNNATLFYDGYWSVLSPLFKSGKYKLVGQPAGTWTPTVALTEFEQAYTAHPNINAVLMPNDEMGHRSSSTSRAKASSRAPSRSLGRTPRSRASATCLRAISAAPCTSPSTWRRRAPWPWPFTCAQA
jgi:D-xylose transport system substrate-binding protein